MKRLGNIKTDRRPRIYLAGPDVFVPDPAALVKIKKEILSTLGLEGCAPVDSELKAAGEYASGKDLAFDIARLNFRMMDSCDSCICQLTPYQGASADVGTVGELHYMYAQGKPVFAYSNDARPFFDRVRDDHYRGGVEKKMDPYFKVETVRGRDGLLTEDFGLFDNLMIPFAIEDSGGSFHSCSAAKENYYTGVAAFEEAAKSVAAYFFGGQAAAEKTGT